MILDRLVLKYSDLLFSDLCKNATYSEESEQKTGSVILWFYDSRPGWTELWRSEDTRAWRDKQGFRQLRYVDYSVTQLDLCMS